MKLYRCDLCGRVFDRPTTHNCKGGNCCKDHSHFTEFEVPVYEYNKKTEVDDKEDILQTTESRALVLNDRLNPEIGYLPNWEQARIDAAIAAMPIADKIVDGLYGSTCKSVLGNSKMHSIDFFVDECVRIADALVEGLKKNK